MVGPDGGQGATEAASSLRQTIICPSAGQFVRLSIFSIECERSKVISKRIIFDQSKATPMVIDDESCTLRSINRRRRDDASASLSDGMAVQGKQQSPQAESVILEHRITGSIPRLALTVGWCFVRHIPYAINVSRSSGYFRRNKNSPQKVSCKSVRVTRTASSFGRVSVGIKVVLISHTRYPLVL